MNKSDLVYFIEKFIPDSLIKKHRENKTSPIWKKQHLAYWLAERKLKCTNRPLNVIFLVLYPSVWKYDSVYKLMEKDLMFNPLVLICPVLDRGYEHMVETLHGTQDLFRSRGYNTKVAYDETTGTYINMDSLSPDILMYAFQWTSHTDPRFDLEHTRKYLKCYVNYSYKNNPFRWSIACEAQSLMWLYFSECEDNKRLIQSFSKAEFQNVRVVGYPMYDEFKTTAPTAKDWKLAKTGRKKIIWAPHHTIEGFDSAIKLSTFLLFADTMVEMAQKYKDQIEIVFKPHPQLKPALYNHPKWGKERTDAYYEWWEKTENTNYVLGAYVDLFLSSDAMIHDCHSFTVEYLYVNKPVMFMTNFDRESQCNEVGKKALACHYHGQTAADIEQFIQKVVLGGEDSMLDKRTAFYNNILVPPNNMSVAENIVHCIKKELKKI